MILDTLTNLVAGLFTSKDKLAHDRFTLICRDRGQLDAAYRGDWIARKIVDVPPFDMTREWRAWQAEDDQIEALEAEEKRLDVRRKVNRALRLARLYGGAALVLGVGDGDPAQPLPAIKKGGLRYLHAMSRWEITAGEIDRDVLSPGFGEPGWYQVASSSANVRIHPSRVVRFVGAEVPDWQLQGVDGWGDSVLQAVWDAVHHAGLTAQGIASLIHEAKVDVIKIPRLSESLSAEGYSRRLIERFTLANTMKSLVNTLILDSEEEWDRKQTSFAQLPEVLDRYLQIAAGAADIPATRLLGQSPAGMNATGESDIRNYYDRIAAEQSVMLTPALSRLDEALITSALGARPPEVHYEWQPLWGLSETEKADIAKKKAETSQIYAVNDLLPPAVMAKVLPNQLTEDGVYPGLEGAMTEYEAGLLEEPDWQEEEPTDPSEEPTAEAVDPRTGRPVADAAPRTLYVSRKVLNAGEIIAWAKGQGFATTLPAGDLHVTIAFSRTPVDWMKAGENWSGDGKGNLEIQAGGPRLVERFGGGAVVLAFASTMLAWRHQSLRELGASWDWPEYQPHITITYEPGDVDVEEVEPYRGPILLGPEIFEEVNEDWRSGVVEDGGGPNADRPFVEDKRRGRSARGGRGHYNPSQPRGANGRWVETGAELRKPLVLGWPGGKRMKAFVDAAVANTGSKARLHFGPVRNAAAIRAATGLDVTGWKRKLGADEVRKILKDHGVAASERARGQVAVTRADFKRIRSIVERPDSIALGGTSRGRALQTIVYQKRLGGVTYTLVEEMQPKRKGLQVKTMWKR